MKCVICRQDEIRLGAVAVTLQRGETIVIAKGVPAEVCDNCAECYLTEEVTRQVLDRAEQAVRNGTEVEELRYAA